MSDELESLRNTLLKGISLSQQSSYARRSPANASVPFLEEARSGLRKFVDAQPNNPDGWRLLSQAEECLLHFEQAVACQERANALTDSPSRKDLKRLALLRQSLREWATLPLSPEQLKSLGDYLVARGAQDEAAGRSINNTRSWLVANGFRDPDTVIAALSALGAYSDFQVLYNVVRG